LDAALAQTLVNCGKEVVFGKLLPVPVHKLCKTFVAHVHLWWRERCV